MSLAINTDRPESTVAELVAFFAVFRTAVNPREEIHPSADAPKGPSPEVLAQVAAYAEELDLELAKTAGSLRSARGGCCRSRSAMSA